MIALSAALELAVGRIAATIDVSIDSRGLVLVGPNGSGKTSLLLALLGVLRPTWGRVALGDDLLFDAKLGCDVPPEDRGIAYVPQDFGLFPHLTAAQNVTFALSCLRPPPARAERRARALAWLADLRISHTADRRPATLSGGERQKVALARALAITPRALLLDEPLAALDAGARDELRPFLREQLVALGRPFVIVTHDFADATFFQAPVAVLENGRIVQQGTVDELRARPLTSYVSRLVQRPEAT